VATDSLAQNRRQDVVKQRVGGRAAATAAIAYLLIVLCMWGIFALSSGMPYETTFPYVSENSSGLHGFINVDPLRPHTNTFYHLSYLLGEAFGGNGSFAPFQIVYAILWWARGFLLFLILRRLLPRSPQLAYMVGALAIVHASDLALQWVGQMNQFGFIFWMLLAFYLFLVAIDSGRSRAAAVFLLFAAACQYMSLWSYESGLFIILLLPLGVLFARWPTGKRRALLMAVWYIVPAVYIRAAVLRYWHSGGQSYQESVLRTDWSMSSILNDLGINIARGLEFWTWRDNLAVYVPVAEMVGLAMGAVAVYFSGALLLRLARRGDANALSEGLEWRPILALMAAGLVWVVLSFPAYLLLNSARGFWRTQFLAGPGAAAVFAAVAALLFSFLPYRRVREAAAVCAGAVVVYYGVCAAVQLGGRHRDIWEQHRRAVAKLLRAVPQVKPDTVIVLVDVPQPEDPFRNDMWFDFALRLAYPATPVSGVYFYTDGSAAPGDNLKLQKNQWNWDGTLIAPLVRSTTLDDTIIVDYEAGGAVRMLDTVPDFLCAKTCAAETYSPRSRILDSHPSPRAVRRYGPV